MQVEVLTIQSAPHHRRVLKEITTEKTPMSDR
jgi:hypothetical protein